MTDDDLADLASRRATQFPTAAALIRESTPSGDTHLRDVHFAVLNPTPEQAEELIQKFREAFPPMVLFAPGERTQVYRIRYAPRWKSWGVYPIKNGRTSVRAVAFKGSLDRAVDYCYARKRARK